MNSIGAGPDSSKGPVRPGASMTPGAKPTRQCNSSRLLPLLLSLPSHAATTAGKDPSGRISKRQKYKKVDSPAGHQYAQPKLERIIDFDIVQVSYK